MASEKRKAVEETRPKKKAKTVTNNDHDSTIEPKKAKSDKPREKRLAAKSVLLEEEKAFPRGGAGVLTPLEHKQIRAQAERDVLFEQKTGQKVEGPADEQDLFDTSKPQKSSKRKTSKAGGHSKQIKDDTPYVRVQGLSFKTLVPGSIVLGRVIAITSKDLALALPNNLTGFVPITSISTLLTKRIEALLDEDEDDNKSNAEYEDVDLHQLFSVGQWLRAAVMETETASSDNQTTKRHIELSIDPVIVNAQLEADAVTTYSFLQATIRSVEDHGVVTDLGLADPSVKGFTSKKELGAAYKIGSLQEGQVLLCMVTGKASGGMVVKLSPNASRFSVIASSKQGPNLADVTNVDLLLPGSSVDVLITHCGATGVAGKVMGLVDVTADITHAGISQLSNDELSAKYKIGTRIKARIISSIPKDDGSKQIGVSFLEHMLAVPTAPAQLEVNASTKQRDLAASLEQHVASSTISQDAVITKVISDRGIYFDLREGDGRTTRKAFAHLSQISDKRMDAVPESANAYQLGTSHKVRILNFNPVDGIYYVSMKESILSQPFLRLEDLKVGERVDGIVERLLLGTGNDGVTGILVKLANHITALVPSLHISDVALKHPEQKFRQGTAIKGRVLNVDLEKRQARITIKKSLVSQDDSDIWSDYAALNPGSEARGTITKLLDRGAVVQFFGNVRAFLPISEMSDAFVEHPTKQFRLGQTVMARVLSVDADKEEMIVSCKAGGAMDEKSEEVWTSLQPVQVISASVTALAPEHVEVEIEGGVRGLIRVGHLLDGSASKASSMLKKLRVGQNLSECVVLSKTDRSRQVVLSHKPSLVEAAKAGSLARGYRDVRQAHPLAGFVQNITPEGVYVEFANRLVGFVPKAQVSPESMQLPHFALRKDQSIKCWVLHKDDAKQRFILTMREMTPAVANTKKASSKSEQAVADHVLANAMDESLQSTSDLTLNKVTKARVASVKSTQINVRLADDVHGRIDVSEVFDNYSDIKNPTAPLQNLYKTGDIIDVKVLGIRDARGWRFLPFSGRTQSNTVVELSAKPSRVKKGNTKFLQGYADLKEGDECLGFVNNITNDCVWMTLSPGVRGKVSLMDLGDDIGLLQNTSKHFPIGSAHKMRVKKVQPESGHLDLTGRSADDKRLTIEMLNPGNVLPGRITKVADHSVTVTLSEDIGAAVSLAEISDDYDNVDTAQYTKGEVTRVKVLQIDPLNKRVWLSLRPSLVLSSSLPVKDAHISTSSDVRVGGLVRGFVRFIGDKGVSISLSGTVDGFVRISDLSDNFIKEWQTHLKLGQLVGARVLAIDSHSKHITLSLKASHTDKDYVPPVKFEQLKVGRIVTGVVRKIEDFGVFVDLDNTQPRISGLAHRSEIAEKRVADVRGLYDAGDKVKAKILKIDREGRKISLGLKASYFKDDADDLASEDEDDGEGIIIPGDSDDDGDDEVSEDGGVELDAESIDENEIVDSMDIDEEEAAPVQGLTTSGFDWTGDDLDMEDAAETQADAEPVHKKRKRAKAEPQQDLTGDLDVNGPQNTSDFERQLLGQPNDSALWIQYMAFHLQLSEIDKARSIAERALRTIHIRETDEKQNIWIARLNLEVEYGDDDQVEEIFKQACQMQDSLNMHEKLASIYIGAGKNDKADNIFERIVGNKAFRASPDVWLNYATFLLIQMKQPEKARALLPRALQSMPQNEHRMLTAKFAALEFRSDAGDAERGRTIFENLVTEWPKWTNAWDMWADIERGRMGSVEKDKRQEAINQVRDLYERMSRAGMKKKRAKFVFKRWLEFEEEHGSDKDQERVKALAREFVEKLAAKGDDE